MSNAKVTNRRRRVDVAHRHAPTRGMARTARARARGDATRRSWRARVALALVGACVGACATRSVDAMWFGKKSSGAAERVRADALDDGTTPGARGGTELMSVALEARVPRALVKRFHVVKSRVRALSADARRPNVLWLQDLPNDPESEHLREEKNREKFAKFMFVSEWQKSAYESYFGDVFGEKAVVMRNAIEPFERQRKEPPEDGVLRLIYHTTPHRGLDILMHVFPRLYDAHEGMLHLDVYSSFSIYGWHERDHPYAPLFQACEQHPGCTYHGAVSNDDVRDALRSAHIFAYPSTWMETSCIAAIEALSAGVHVVTSSLGALVETVGTFGTIYEFKQDWSEHADAFEQAMHGAIESYWEVTSVRLRRVQQVYASQIFGWGSPGLRGRADDWVVLLGGIHEDFNGGRDVGRDDFDSDGDYSDALFVAGRVRESRGDQKGAYEKYLQSLEFNPLNSYTMVAMSTLEIMVGESNGDHSTALRGIERMESAIDDPDGLSPPLEPNSAAYFGIAMRSGYWRETRNWAARARINFEKGLNTSQHGEDDCWELYYATIVPHFPLTPEEERRRIQKYNAGIDEMLRKDDLFCRNQAGLGNVFSIAYYFDGVDYKDEYSRWVQLKLKAFPDLLYKANALVYENDDNYLSSAQSTAVQKALMRRKIKIGAVSSFFTSESSIWGNFGEIVLGLQRDARFEVDMVHYPRDPIKEEDINLSLRPERSIVLIKGGDLETVKANREAIEERRFDVLIYLDLFMTGEMHDLAVAKLAPVQMVTHGHPVTSGIPAWIMDYFISWDLAELPDQKKAQSFYTEELLLVKSKKAAWEYYKPRTEGEVSIIVGEAPFYQFTRENLDFIPAEEMEKLSSRDGLTWYFCPQAVFKYHITFDQILGKIQREDPNAIIILMKLVDNALEALHEKVVERLIKQGDVDLDRVVFIPRMKHYQLMAMYKLSDVVLDSVYFGGDTTTREAFEVGSPVITLPGKTIGQRWTQAYYRVMGIKDFIARTVDEYVRIAVKAANATDKQKSNTRARIKKALHKKLFKNADAPRLWGDAIMSALQKPKRWHWIEAEPLKQHDEL